jgi:ribosomal protein S6--L-glutamate ligase
MLEGRVYMPLKPESILIAHNKFLTLLTLKEVNLPVPPTFLSASRSTIESLLDEMSYPVVMKLLYGSIGKGVMFADSKASAITMMDTLERFREPIFLEEYVENPGEDIRVFVLGDDVLGAMKRIAKKDERRSNIGIGGIGKPIKLKREWKDLAIKASHYLGMRISGIDLIKGPKGPMIIEANVNVHFEGLTKYTNINVAKAIIDFIKSELEGRPRVERFIEWLRGRSRI